MSFEDVDEVVRARMRRIRKTDTKPEMIVRRLVHSMGYRYRLHRRDLPGTPDLVFPSRKKVIQVHGCFWHQHERCRLANAPKKRTHYWGPKLRRNVERDAKNEADLRRLGWEQLTVWECETATVEQLTLRLERFFSGLCEGR